MNLQDIFNALSSGELSQLSIGGKAAGVIDSQNRGKLIPHINLGLTALFKRFRLKEGELVIQLKPDKLRYLLTSDYAASQSGMTSDEVYILDTDNPFTDDLLKIESVLTDLGFELPLNDAIQAYSVTTPRLNTLVVPKPIVDRSNDLPDVLKTSQLKLVYRANHTKLTYDPRYDYSYVDGDQLELPDAYMEALLYFVASRINNPIGMTNEFHAGNSYMMKYEQECQRLEADNLQVDMTQTNSRLVRNGWV